MTAKDTAFEIKNSLSTFAKILDLNKPCVMAILNLTPDSFFGNSRTESIEKAILKTEQFIEQGASIIDLGAYSSRPNATHIDEKEEEERLIPTLKALVKKFPKTLFSIDTFRAHIAEKAINEGAHLINDISAGNLDPLMFKTIAKLQVPYIMMHMKGTPQNMSQNTDYKDINLEIFNYFEDKIKQLQQLGINEVMIDPGFGFSKTIAQNYEVLQNLESLNALKKNILVGFSRKSMIYKTLHTDAENALNGTTVLNTIALLKGAKILRVHDVKEAKECIDLISQLPQQ